MSDRRGDPMISVTSDRRIDTTAPLAGGGALNQDRTLTLSIGAGLQVLGGALVLAPSGPQAGKFVSAIGADGVLAFDVPFPSVSANTLLGNPHAIVGGATEVAIGSTLSFSGVVLRTGAGTGDVAWSADSFATTIQPHAVGNSKFRQSAGLSVVGAAGAATADVADITGAAGQVLAVNAAGSALAFTGAPVLSTSMTVPAVYGGTAAGSTLTVNGTSNGSPSSAHLVLQGNGQKVGINNAAPKTPLDINTNTSTSPALVLSTSVVRVQGPDGGSGGQEWVSYVGATGNTGNWLAGAVAAGSAAAPTPPAVGAHMFNLRGLGYNSGWQLSSIIVMAAAEAWSAGHQGSSIDIYTTPIASTSVALAARIQPSGGFSVGGAADPGIGGIQTIGGITPGSFTVATLPTGVTGKTVWCSNCRVFNGAGTQEGAGVGTGGFVTYNGTAWKIAGTNVTAVA
ncbi:hypothetical protein ACVWXN_003458 [Bradyrhizobium sp. i1.4.4]